MKKEYQMMIIAPGSPDQANTLDLVKKLVILLKEGWEIQRVDSIGGHLLYLIAKEVEEYKDLK